MVVGSRVGMVNDGNVTFKAKLEKIKYNTYNSIHVMYLLIHIAFYIWTYLSVDILSALVTGEFESLKNVLVCR